MIKNQFGRRSLNAFAMAELALKLEDFFKEKAKENKTIAVSESNKNRTLESNKNPNPHKYARPEIEPVETRKELAKVAGVSHGTISKVKEIKNTTPVEVKDTLGDMIHTA